MLPLADLEALRAWPTAVGVAVHLDGARLWNAHVATGSPLATYGARGRRAGVCFSKGLGAPVGSMLVGSDDAMAEARVWRKRLGGGMRQVGILAAGAAYALDHHVDRLAEDHAHARLLAETLADAAPGSVKPDQVETNIVVADLSATGTPVPQVVESARSAGLLVSGVGPTHLRVVTHLDASTEDCRAAAETLARLVS